MRPPTSTRASSWPVWSAAGHESCGPMASAPQERATTGAPHVIRIPRVAGRRRHARAALLRGGRGTARRRSRFGFRHLREARVRRASYVWTPSLPTFVEAISTGGVPHASTLLRRRLWSTITGFDESLRSFELLDFWASAFEHGARGTILAEPFLNYRVRAGSGYRRSFSLRCISTVCDISTQSTTTRPNATGWISFSARRPSS